MTATKEIPMPPTPAEVAAEWIAIDGPDIKCKCVQCGIPFPVQGIGGPSLICPRCGFMPGKQSCRYIMEELTARRKRGEVAAMKDVPVEGMPSNAPPGLDEVIGNASAVSQIRTALEAHRARAAAGSKAAFPHLLLCGPGGLGKTLLAEVISRELKRPIRLQMGQSLSNPSRVGDVLMSLKSGDVLFVDEIAGLKMQSQEALYRAMEDGVFVPIDKAGKPVRSPVRLPPFTLIGATTDAYKLQPSMLQRFKYRVSLERMTADELAQAIAARAVRKGWILSAEAAKMVADRTLGTPRLAVGLLDGCMDTALAGGTNVIDAMIVKATCSIWGIDKIGLDRTVRRYLAILDEAGAGPVRLNVLATKLDGLSRRTVETRVEPDLVFLGFITKEANGRSLTDAGRRHLRSENGGGI